MNIKALFNRLFKTEKLPVSDNVYLFTGKDDFPAVKTDKYHGFIYILDMGNTIKISYTKTPETKINKELKTNKVKRIALTIPHVNHRSNKKKLIHQFKAHKLNGYSLFRMPFSVAYRALLTLEYIDKSQYEKEA